MPGTPFSKDETVFLTAYLSDWIARGKEVVKPGQTMPRNRLESEIVAEFWDSFPDRKTGGERAFEDSFIEGFSQTLHQWYMNKARPKSTKALPPVDQAVKKLTARTLFIQNNRAAIAARVQELRINSPEMNQMTAWNKAASEIIETAQEQDPEEFKRLNDLASQIRNSHSADYTERSTEDLTRVLKQIPKTLVNQIHEWSRTTGAVFFMLALYELPVEPGLKSVEALSPSISGLSTASDGNKARKLIIDWIVEELGTSLSRNPESSQPAVYPDKHSGMRPVMPQDGKEESYFVQPKHFPPGETRVPDLNRLQKPACIAWFNFLGRSSKPRFQFCRVLDDADTKADAQANVRAWKSLPLARTEGIYVSVLPADVDDLKLLSKHAVNLTDLANLVNKLEEYGPAHQLKMQLEDPALIQDGLNAHFPNQLDDSSFQSLMSNTWAPVTFFDANDKDYNSYALSTLAHWIKTSTRFRHVPTGTWRGGPQGVQWNLAALACIVLSLTAVDYCVEVPPKIQRVSSPEIQERLWQQAGLVAQWLSRSLQQSIETLAKTFDQRARAWQAGVLAEYYNQQSNPLRFASARSTPVADSTSGLPTETAEIHAYAQKLIQAGVSVPETDVAVPIGSTEPTIELPLPQLTKRRPKARRNESPESFDLDRITDTTEDTIPPLDDSLSDDQVDENYDDSVSEKGVDIRMKLPDSAMRSLKDPGTTQGYTGTNNPSSSGAPLPPASHFPGGAPLKADSHSKVITHAKNKVPHLNPPSGTPFSRSSHSPGGAPLEADSHSKVITHVESNVPHLNPSSGAPLSRSSHSPGGAPLEADSQAKVITHVESNVCKVPYLIPPSGTPLPVASRSSGGAPLEADSHSEVITHAKKTVSHLDSPSGAPLKRSVGAPLEVASLSEIITQPHTSQTIDVIGSGPSEEPPLGTKAKRQKKGDKVEASQEASNPAGRPRRQVNLSEAAKEAIRTAPKGRFKR
ncbi:hypothetical protein BDV93DRAFT_510606 [Ceratobasidium sp. AG-I]|nr:hypothetical protein BDV93DRAFT_510606 [Ceratobasidium sp. AG-I]